MCVRASAVVLLRTFARVHATTCCRVRKNEGLPADVGKNARLSIKEKHDDTLKNARLMRGRMKISVQHELH